MEETQIKGGKEVKYSTAFKWLNGNRNNKERESVWSKNQNVKQHLVERRNTTKTKTMLYKSIVECILTQGGEDGRNAKKYEKNKLQTQ